MFVGCVNKVCSGFGAYVKHVEGHNCKSVYYYYVNITHVCFLSLMFCQNKVVYLYVCIGAILNDIDTNLYNGLYNYKLTYGFFSSHTLN